MSTATSADPLPDDPVALQALVQRQRARIAELEQRLAWFLVQYRLAQYRRFAASTETGAHQLDLFAELLTEVLPEDTATKPLAAPVPLSTERDSAAVARGRSGRRRWPASLPGETILHEVADDQKACPCGGQSRAVIGEKRSEQLDIE